MFEELARLGTPPPPFSVGTAADLWTDPYVSEQLLAAHLDPDVDAASRNHAFIDRSAAWLIETFDLGPGRSVVDLGCGPGLYTSRFARSGAAVHGIDLSERSIAHARETAHAERLDVTYTVGDYLTHVPAGGHDLATMIMCDLGVLSPDGRRRVLANVRASLRRGGAFVFDVCSLTAFARRTPSVTFGESLMEGFWSPERYFGFLHRFTYPEDHVTVDQYTIVEAGRTRQVWTWLQHFAPADLEADLERHGFELRQLLGDVAGGAYDPEGGEFAVVAVAR